MALVHAPRKGQLPGFQPFPHEFGRLAAKSPQLYGILTPTRSMTEPVPYARSRNFLRFVVHVQRLCLCPAILSGDQSKSDGVSF